MSNDVPDHRASMRAVTGYCRFPSLAITSILIAGCGTAAPASSSPSTAAALSTGIDVE
jgi:hypothetical protein